MKSKRGEMGILDWLNRIQHPLAKGFHPTGQKGKKRRPYIESNIYGLLHIERVYDDSD